METAAKRAGLTGAKKVQLDGRRSLAVWIAVVLGLLIAVITELESALHLLAFVPVLLVWVAIAVGAAVVLSRVRWDLPPRPRVDPWSGALIACSLVIILVIAVTAWVSPPNSYDAITYHLPRVMYWAQNRSVAVYPTLYGQQNYMPPFAGYTELQIYILSRGGDRFPNLIQVLAFAGMICAVSLIARELGANIRGQAIACLAAATIPAAVWQAPEALNDVFLAFWLVAMTWFAVRYAKWLRRADLIGIAATFALALLAKGSVFALAPPLLLPAVYSAFRRGRRELATLACTIAVFALVLNVPFQVRIFGPAARHMDTVHVNHSIGLRPTLSNALRVGATLMGSNSDAANRTLFRVVALAHLAMHQDLNDPAITFPNVRTQFQTPSGVGSNANLIPALLLILTLPAGILVSIRSRSALLLFYCIGIFLAYLGFCAVFRYNPWNGRFLIPVMALGGVLTGLIGERFLPSGVQALLAVALVWSILPILTRDGLHPLLGERSIFLTQRDSNYFRSIPLLEQPYRNAIRFVLGRGCKAVGIDYTDGAYQQGLISAYEFPVMQFLSREGPVHFYHPTLDPSITTAYREPACAILCLDCALDPRKQQRYGRMSSRHFDPAIVYYTDAPVLRSAVTQQ